MPAPTGSEKEELAVTLAALALYDDNLPITVSIKFPYFVFGKREISNINQG